MPIRNFIGKTFVAFTDISGFTQLMNSERQAIIALDTFYTAGYEILRRGPALGHVEGLFISDSGILFIRPNSDTGDLQDLIMLLSVIEKLNKEMLSRDFMLTTSISYGPFRYQQRIEFDGIRKESIFGNAYISAFFDNEKVLPRIQPGQCRICAGNMPVNLEFPAGNNDPILCRLKERPQDTKHQYFYWNVENPENIDSFEEQYRDSYNLKFKGMLSALKRPVNNY